MKTNTEEIEDLKNEIIELKNDIRNVGITIKNENGVATKYADGTMVCTKTVVFNNVNFNIQDGNVYKSEMQSLGDFAAQFTELDGIFPQNFSNGSGSEVWLGKIDNVSNTSAGAIRLCRATNTQATLKVCIIAWRRLERKKYRCRSILKKGGKIIWK